LPAPDGKVFCWRIWSDGPNWIMVGFTNGKEGVGKDIHLATVWETIHWYGEKSYDWILDHLTPTSSNTPAPESGPGQPLCAFQDLVLPSQTNKLPSSSC